MRQKIVIRVSLHCEKCRAKAMEIAAGVSGVDSVALIGKERDHVEVIGDGIDSVKLVQQLRKKVGPAEIVSAGEVKNVERCNRNYLAGENSESPATALLLPPPPPWYYHHCEPKQQDEAGCTIL